MISDGNEKITYYLINDHTLGKMINPPTGECYIYSAGRWVPDKNHEIMDRLVGYDPYEDSCYSLGNTDIMDEIKEISLQEAETFIHINK